MQSGSVRGGSGIADRIQICATGENVYEGDDAAPVVEQLAREVRNEGDVDVNKLQKLGKELHQMLMRYPCSEELLALLRNKGLVWHGRPLRGKKLVRAARQWTDRTATAADSSFFSALGTWTSPYAVPFFTIATLTF